MKRTATLALALMILCGIAAAADPMEIPKNLVTKAPEGKRIGIIGLDTSHVFGLSNDFDNPQASADFKGFRVVAAYPMGSRDIVSSTERRDDYTRKVKAMGIEVVDSIPALLEKVDFVLLESNDGRVHLEQALPVLKAHKPVFIDKPMAGSLTDVVAIFRAAEKYGTPVFTASMLRWFPQLQELRDGSQGALIGADTFGPAMMEKTHPDLYWYGIHGVEMLYTLMGTGCVQVTSFHNDDSDFCVGEWPANRIGTYRGTRKSKYAFGGSAFCEKAQVPLIGKNGYDGIALAIAKFFETGKSPVPRDEMIEIYTFMSAAEASKLKGGRPVKLADVLQQAQAEAEKIKIE